MKFIFADSIDMVDPGYDFAADRNAPGRKPYWDDLYPHEIMQPIPYDGVLVSRGIVGDHRFKGKYSSSQSMRFARVGARVFLRLDAPQNAHKLLFGDCGAFSYARLETPPYTPDEMINFYQDGQFTHGMSVDHVIFEFNTSVKGHKGGSSESRSRFDITQENARLFLKASQRLGKGFTPIGVAQGWSPDSMASASRQLELMGYSYIALGGMVPLNSSSIHSCLQSVRSAISPNTRIHLLGFAKADQIHEFAQYGIESFDTTSPLIRAFKDDRCNYYVLRQDGTLDYYTAIRIPQALENPRLLRAVKTGRLKQEELSRLETNALRSVRAYDRGTASLEDAIDAVVQYNIVFATDESGIASSDDKVSTITRQVRRTLSDKPWNHCSCEICQESSVEVAIFRTSNRNKRRGFHNLGVFYKHVQRVLEAHNRETYADLSRYSCATEFAT
jgi:hypothetical protein